MTDRAELVEAALDVYPDGLALLDLDGRVVYWNRAAEVITGYSGSNLVGRPVPGVLEALTLCRGEEDCPDSNSRRTIGRGLLVHVQHSRGHDLPMITRKVILRDNLGSRIGTASSFHSAENRIALPHAQSGDADEVKQSQIELRDHLENEFEIFLKEGIPLGVLWVSVDQSPDLRKSHGAAACETMVESVERTLANALYPDEIVGRWSDDEFLVLSHQVGGEALANRGQVLAGLARTADFHWWGDRISPTVSVGAAQADNSETLPQLLERAQAAMLASIHAGGNHVTLAPWRQECSRS